MSVHDFPPTQDLETKPVLRKLAEAHRHLAELKGAAATIPNESILINTLGRQEARASSEIENIVTTRDDRATKDRDIPGAWTKWLVGICRTPIRLRPSWRGDGSLPPGGRWFGSGPTPARDPDSPCNGAATDASFRA